MGLSKNIAYRLRTLREAAGLSQQEVADRADLSLSLITKMEQARKADPARASTLLALAGALGVRPGQLIEDLTAPPEGVFPPKGKKHKKKKKKKLAAVLAGVGTNGASVGHGDGDAQSFTPNPLSVTPHEEVATAPKKRKKKGQ